MRKPTTSSEDARHWVLCFTLFHLVSPCKWHRMTSLSIENWQTLWCIGMYQLRTFMEHSLFDGLTWHCLVGSMWGTWKTIWKSQKFHTELASSDITGVVSFNSISWHVCRKQNYEVSTFSSTFWFTLSPPAFQTFLSSFWCPNCRYSSRFWKVFARLGFDNPSPFDTSYHCSLLIKKKLHRGLLPPTPLRLESIY